MEDILTTLKENLSLPYLLTILLTGYYFTKEEVLLAFGNSKIKTFLLGVAKSYKVLFISFVIGIFYYHAANVDSGKLFFTFVFANSFYELLMKWVFIKIDSLTKNN
jgi:hypothetical protein